MATTSISQKRIGTQMSYANVAKVIGGLMVAGIVYAAGYVTSNVRGKKAREEPEKENERLRTEIRAYMDTVREAFANCEAAMADIFCNPPLTRKDFVDRLRQHKIPDRQIDNIVSDLDAKGVFRKAS
jgi:acetyl-CoA carboxylase carboxyltransferase component